MDYIIGLTILLLSIPGYLNAYTVLFPLYLPRSLSSCFSTYLLLPIHHTTQLTHQLHVLLLNSDPLCVNCQEVSHQLVVIFMVIIKSIIEDLLSKLRIVYALVASRNLPSASFAIRKSPNPSNISLTTRVKGVLGIISSVFSCSLRISLSCTSAQMLV